MWLKSASAPTFSTQAHNADLLADVRPLGSESTFDDFGVVASLDGFHWMWR
jgi:hypothetical protein